MNYSEIRERVAEVQGRIAAAAQAAGRDPASITLVGASKEQSVERCGAALHAGLTDLGENRAQELLAKAPTLARDETVPTPVWHFIGQLQRNKVRSIAPWVSWWHSVDRVSLATEIARHQPGARVLLEVSVAGESQKGGIAPAELDALLEACADLGLRAEGLMTVPPLGRDPAPVFAALREMAHARGLLTLSMGMTSDYEVAIREGATIVRVGRAIFGARGEHLDEGLPG